MCYSPHSPHVSNAYDNEEEDGELAFLYITIAVYVTNFAVGYVARAFECNINLWNKIIIEKHQMLKDVRTVVPKIMENKIISIWQVTIDNMRNPIPTCYTMGLHMLLIVACHAYPSI